MIFNIFFSSLVKQQKTGFCPGGESRSTANGYLTGHPLYKIKLQMFFNLN